MTTWHLIKRKHAKDRLQTGLARSSAVALVGPRQCGKTTLCRQFVPADSINYFDLEDIHSLARLDQPKTALSELKGLIVIDEIQHRPDLFPLLRVLIDHDRTPGRFLLLGSAAIKLLRQSSESLAGRLEVVELSGFSLQEVGRQSLNEHWLRGGFPMSFLASSVADSFAWRKNFIRSYIERDLPQMGIELPATTVLRFWTMLAHFHGQISNASALARAMSANESTSRKYVDLLEDLFMVRQLQPWYANLKKRQVKAPKIYLRDTGLLHYLLGIKTMKNLLEHPNHGASWEGYIIEEVLKVVPVDGAYFWATHSGAELDLLILHEGRKYGIECKRIDAPRVTPSIRTALADLELEKVTIIYPGPLSYKIADRVYAMPVSALATKDVLQLITLVDEGRSAGSRENGNQKGKK